MPQRVGEYDKIEAEPLALTFELVPAIYITPSFARKAVPVALALPNLHALSLDSRNGLVVTVLLTRSRNARSDLYRARAKLNRLLQEEAEKRKIEEMHPCQ